MNFLAILLFHSSSKTIIEFPELEQRSADEVCQSYQSNYEWKKTTKCYTEGTGCNYGTHSSEDIEMTTKRLNFYRQLVGLSTVTPSTSNNDINYVNYASLIMEKNNRFNHDLSDTSLECWSENGQTGAANSNIYWTSGEACSTDSISSYIDDSKVDSLGHRRWILNPPYAYVASGVAGHFSALLVMLSSVQNQQNIVPTFIAYPPPGPVPHDVIYKNWSFSRNYKSTSSDEHNKMPDDTKVNVFCNGQKVDVEMSLFKENSVMYPGIVKFNTGNMDSGTFCKVSISSDSADTEWRYTVQAIKCVNGKAEDVNQDAFKDDNNENDKPDNDDKKPVDGGGKPGDNGGEGNKGLDTGGIVGIVVAVIVVVVIVIVVVIVVIKRKKNDKNISSVNENQKIDNSDGI